MRMRFCYFDCHQVGLILPSNIHRKAIYVYYIPFVTYLLIIPRMNLMNNEVRNSGTSDKFIREYSLHLLSNLHAFHLPHEIPKLHLSRRNDRILLLFTRQSSEGRLKDICI
jgi:hypothetical protein